MPNFLLAVMMEAVPVETASQPHTAWDIAVAFVDKLAWPVVALIIVTALRRPIGLFIKAIGERATEISIAGWATVKLPTMTQAPVTEELSALKADAYPALISNSAKRTLFALFQDRTRKEYVVVNFGRGSEWLSSRLYISALMLERMTELKGVVFVAAGAGTETKFLGVGQPSTVRWAVARAQPWLEVAFAQAYQNALINAVQPPVEDEHGRMDPSLAETVVSSFISQVTPPIAIPPAYPVSYPPPVAGGATARVRLSAGLGRPRQLTGTRKLDHDALV
jgi:hypothetical protein